jgi:ribose/xylose/arabinose/galactoside ABC-type transport system permease subunit
MQKGNTFRRLMRLKAVPLLVILLILVIATMVISSGVLEAGRFRRSLRAASCRRKSYRIFNKLVVQSFMICGIILVLIGGNIDLSVAGQAGITAMLFAWFCQNTKLHWGILFVLCVAMAAVLGLINTFLVNRMRFPSFIATIGMSSIYAGLCNLMTKGDNIQISAAAHGSFLSLGRANLGGFLPVTFVIAAAVMLIYQFILSRTTFGRNVFMCAAIRTQRAVRSEPE